MIKAVKLTITGKVQGVYYRGWSKEQADKLGLHGWARNRLDGTVEILLKGDSASVDAMIDLCHQGPKFAAVERVDLMDTKGITPARFDIKPTV